MNAIKFRQCGGNVPVGYGRREFMGVIGAVFVGVSTYHLIFDILRYGEDWLQIAVPGVVGVVIVFCVFFMLILPAQYRAMKRDRAQYLE